MIPCYQLSRVVEEAQVVFNVSAERVKEDVLQARKLEASGQGEEGISRYLFSSIEVLWDEDEGGKRGGGGNKRNLTDRLSEFAGIFERAYTQKVNKVSPVLLATDLFSCHSTLFVPL